MRFPGRPLAQLTPRGAGRLALALGAVLILLWVLSVAGHPAGTFLPRAVALLGLAATALSARGLRRFLAPPHRPQGPLLAAVLVVAVLVGFAGIGHEVGKGYYTDEGHYLHHANEINSGKPFTRSFVYPHLLYHLDAFALWLASLFPAPVAWLSQGLFGVGDPAAIPWLVLRLVTAAMGVLTVVPVFILAHRLGGPLAGTLAGGLTALAVQYHKGFQVNICDVPSAFFATLCLMFVGRLAERERTADYVLAGVAAGLAAAAKYPAGLVAVAIVGVYLVHRIRERRFGWGLLWAGLVSLGTFVALHPSLLVFPEAALFGPRGFFFGVRQYAQGGWIGVKPPSNTLYYAEQLLANFRLPAVLVAALGLVGLERRQWRRLLELLPYPAAFLVLICSMNMVVVRNLFPVIPALAVLLGVAAAAMMPLLLRRPVSAAPAVAAVVLVLPAAGTFQQTMGLARASTREVMSAWVREHIPRGAGILKESYTPDFAAHEYQVVQRRFAFRIPQERLQDPQFDFLLLAGSAYYRFFRPENQSEHRANWYRNVFDTHRLLHEVEPDRFRLGPRLRLYRLEGRPVVYVRSRIFESREAFLAHPSMGKQPEGIRYTRPGRFALFKGAFAPGRYRVRAKGALSGPGVLLVRDLDNALVAEIPVVDGEATVELPRQDKYLFYLYLPAGSRISQLDIQAPRSQLSDPNSRAPAAPPAPLRSEARTAPESCSGARLASV
ncbi:MAG: glycosyltransferase family 39 protein [bacterium]|nr:glycosyltransferase family 39 protein [bacterium]